MKINKVYHKPNTLIKTVDNQRIGLYSNGGLDYVFQGFETTVDKNYVNSKDKVLLESQAQLKSAYKQNLKNSFLRNSENENSITDFTKDHRRELNSNPSLIARSFRLLNIPFHKNKHMFITRADSSMITDTNGVKLYPLSTVGSNPWLDNSSFTELLTTDFEPREVEKIDDKATFMYLHLNNLGVKMRDAIVLHNTAHSDEAIPYVGTSTATALGSLYPAIYAKTIYRA